MDYIVDTCILQYRHSKSPEFELYKPHLQGKVFGVSFQAYAELTVLPAYMPDWYRFFFEERMAAVIYPDAETCRIWGGLFYDWKEVKGKNSKPPAADLWHAATAIHQKLPLVTHNRRDFELFDKLQLVCEAPLI